MVHDRRSNRNGDGADKPGRDSPGPLPVRRPRRDHPRKGRGHHAAAGTDGQRHRAHGSDDGHVHAGPAAAGGRNGPGRRGPDRARPGHVRHAPLRAGRRRDARGPGQARRVAVGGMPADVSSSRPSSSWPARVTRCRPRSSPSSPSAAARPRLPRRPSRTGSSRSTTACATPPPASIWDTTSPWNSPRRWRRRASRSSTTTPNSATASTSSPSGTRTRCGPPTTTCCTGRRSAAWRSGTACGPAWPPSRSPTRLATAPICTPRSSTWGRTARPAGATRSPTPPTGTACPRWAITSSAACSPTCPPWSR